MKIKGVIIVADAAAKKKLENQYDGEVTLLAVRTCLNDVMLTICDELLV